MTLIDKYKFEKYDFSLYFLASLKPGETYDLTPGTKEAHAYLWDCDRVTLELTVSLLLSSLLLYSDLALLRSLSLLHKHNHGTEEEEEFAYHPGNKEKDGFGHIAVAVDDMAFTSLTPPRNIDVFSPLRRPAFAFLILSLADPLVPLLRRHSRHQRERGGEVRGGRCQTNQDDGREGWRW